MTAITEFLLARFEEDEALAQELAAALFSPSSPFDPARVLADVEAKRAIVELHRTVGYEDAEMNEVGTGCYTCGFGTDPCETLCALALPYADHESYDESWRP